MKPDPTFYHICKALRIPSLKILHQDSFQGLSLKLKISASHPQQAFLLWRISILLAGILALTLTHSHSHLSFLHLHRLLLEKYDGVRGFWNPLKKKLYSRYGKPFAFPQAILNEMPHDIFLDGELWYPSIPPPSPQSLTQEAKTAYVYP